MSDPSRPRLRRLLLGSAILLALAVLLSPLLLRWIPLEDYLVERLQDEARRQDLDLQIREVRYQPPNQLELLGITARRLTGSHQVPLQIERCRLTLALRPLLRSTALVTYRAELLGGQLEGTLAARAQGSEAGVRLEPRLKGVQIGQLLAPRGEVPDVTGTLDGEAVLGWTDPDGSDAAGTIHLEARDGILRFPQELPHGSRIVQYDRLVADLIVELPVVRITRAVLDGEVALILDGKIVLGPTPEETTLALTVRLPMREADGSLNEAASLALRVGGTAASPVVGF